MEKRKECPDPVEFSLHGKDAAPFTVLISPPQVPSPSALLDEREIDISHFMINLYDNTLLARHSVHDKVQPS